MPGNGGNVGISGKFITERDFKSKFLNLFGAGRNPTDVASAPGRINLIGEHTDYNEGYVLPIAVDRKVLCAGRLRADKRIRIHSTNFGSTYEASAFPPGKPEKARWAAYPIGVLRAAHEEGMFSGSNTGLELAFAGDVPIGAGMSSSAAIELATLRVLGELFGFKIDGVRAAKLCRKAENEYVGVPCGIMDQFASALSRKGHALFLDCMTLACEHVKLPFDGLSVVVLNTGKSRALANSKYRTRRRECESALALLKNKFGTSSWRSVTQDVINKAAKTAGRTERVLVNRARHIITENCRVLDAVKALRKRDIVEFGKLMIMSHDSLRDDFEVSCAELDTMVKIASSLKGVLGARMTGAGFGGCTVNLVENSSIKILETKIFDDYQKVTGLRPEMYVCCASDGAWKGN